PTPPPLFPYTTLFRSSAIRGSPALPPLLPEALGRRQGDRTGRHDLRREEDEELLVVMAAQDALEEPAERRDAAQERQARLGVVRRVAIDAAEHDRLAVLDQHVRVGLAAHLVRDVVDGVGEVRLARFGEDAHEHETVLRDL